MQVSPVRRSNVGATEPISGVVPLILIADIERAAAFYRLLGFEVGNYQPRTGEKP